MRHAVMTQILCLHAAAGYAAIVKVASAKEAAP